MFDRSAAVNMAKAIPVPRSQTGERIVDSYTTVSNILVQVDVLWAGM